MKKTCLSVTFAVIALLASAQTEKMNAFRRVGIGVEVGTMGAGVQVAVPVVSNHLFLVAGWNYAKLSYNRDVPIRTTSWNKQVAKLNDHVNRFNDNSYLVALNSGETLRNITPLPKDIVIDADAKANMSTFKFMLQYYPWEKRSFYLAGGVVFGKENVLTMHGIADDETLYSYRDAVELNDEVWAFRAKSLFHDLMVRANIHGVDNLEDAMHFNIDDKTYSLRDCEFDMTVKMNAVRPYLGIGFGRAIPNKRVGVQFEAGLWYHGKPTMFSSKELDTYDETAKGIAGLERAMSQLIIYPQMTLRLTGRIL